MELDTETTAEEKTRFIVVAPQELDHVWPVVSKDIEQSLDTLQGEMTVDQVRLLAIQGQVILTVIVEKDNSIVMTLGMTVDRLPQYSVLTVFAAGGERLKPSIETHWKDISQLARGLGCKFVEVNATTEAHARIYSGLGFKKTSLTMRRKADDNV